MGKGKATKKSTAVKVAAVKAPAVEKPVPVSDDVVFVELGQFVDDIKTADRQGHTSHVALAILIGDALQVVKRHRGDKVGGTFKKWWSGLNLTTSYTMASNLGRLRTQLPTAAWVAFEQGSLTLTNALDLLAHANKDGVIDAAALAVACDNTHSAALTGLAELRGEKISGGVAFWSEIWNVKAEVLRERLGKLDALVAESVKYLDAFAAGKAQAVADGDESAVVKGMTAALANSKGKANGK